MRVIWRQLLVHPAQIEQTVDLPHQMIGRNHLVEIKRIEKLSLPVFPPTHHAQLPLMPYPPTESRIASRLNGSFATQSRGKQTWSDRPPISPLTRCGHFSLASDLKYRADCL